MHIGRRNILGIVLEETPGTEKDSQHYIPFLECSLVERHTPIADAQAKAVRDEEGSYSVEGKKWGEGGIKVVLDPTTAPYWLALALGTIDSAPDGEKYKHTITQKTDNVPQTATIRRGRVVDTIKFLNSAVDSLELNFADDVATLNAKLFSKYPVEDDESPSALPELKYFTFRNALVKLGSAESPESPAGMDEYKVREFTLKIENNAELIYAPNDNDVDRIAWKGLRVSGSFSLLFESEVQKLAFKDLVKQSMFVSFEDADGNTIEINIPRFRVDNWNPETPLDDLAQEGIDFIAEYDPVEEETIRAEVVNEVEEYLPGA